ncbi:MAG: OmpA family protein [Chloroherpetonaceae bacterium]|nr:OmpA family protein [bacterium]
MKHFFFFSISIISLVVLISACSQPINIVKFKTSDTTITEGNKTYLEWEVQNADSIVLKQLGFDDPILESAPLKSRMMVSPSFTTEYLLRAYSKNDDKQQKCSLIVTQKTSRVDTIIIIKPTVMQEPSNEKSDYVSGLKSIENVDNNSKIKFEIFFIDRINYPNEIKLYVLVKDEFGNFIANLAPPFGTVENSKKYFLNLVEEIDDKEYKIDEFDVEERHDTLAQKYSFSLVLDHSGSMSSTIDDLHNAVKVFLNKMEKHDEASIVKFDHRIERSINLTNDRNYLLNPNIYNGLDDFGGATALIAAADEGIRSIAGSKSVKIEVLFTDGYENASFYPFLFSNQGYSFLPKQLIYKAREENVRVFTIGYGNVDKDLLEKISILTDGKSYYADNTKEIEQIFNELPRIFHNYYLISFKPHKIDGEHKLTLTFGNPDGSSGNIQRKTYIGKIEGFGLDTMDRQWIAYFEFRKDNLSEIYIPVIEKIATFLQNNPKSKIQIHGHTDLTGTPAANMDLSKKRADVVAKELIKFGIPANRIIVIPHGMTEPIWNPEADEYEKQENRRVEFVIIDE